MRVGVDVRSLASSTGRGVSHYTLSLLNQLVGAHSNDEWRLFQTGRRRFALPPSLNRPNVKLTHLGYPNKALNAAWTVQSYPRLERTLGEVDVFFAPNLGFIRPHRRTPLVTTVHDVSYSLHPHFYSWRERAWHRAVNPRRLLRSSTGVIAVSEQTKGELRQVYGLPSEKIQVIHSGIDEVYRRPVSEDAIAAARQKYQLPASYILFLGALEPRKNVATLLAAFGQARQTGLASELVLAGEARPGTVTSGQSEGVHRLGYVAEVDKPALYAAAVMLVSVSLHEGFGFPPLEALACGTPSIVSDLPVFAETLGGAALRVDPLNTAALAEKLVHLERNRPLRASLLEQAPAVLRPLTWQHAADQTYSVLTNASQRHAQ